MRRFWNPNEDIIPIEVRPGEFVRIEGIPHDLTQAEADKIARVIMAFATDAPETGSGAA